MNRIYPRFIATALASVLGESAARDAPDLFFYAVNADYEYDDIHLNLDDVPELVRLGKSKVIPGNLSADGVVTIPVVEDAFELAPLAAVTGLILVAEWADDSLLLVYEDTWENTGVPFSAPAAIRIQFLNDFVFRLGNIGPEV